MYVCTGLEIGGIASPNANHFKGIANHLGKVISHVFLALRITFGRLQITFQINSTKDVFFSPRHFFRRNFLLFKQILRVELKNANQL